MTLMAQAIEYRRLRAPQVDGGTLIDPPPAAVSDLLELNQALRARWGWIATDARRELVAAATRYTRQYRDVAEPSLDAPILIAGHQPQMFHPGVWYKNFVLGRIAQEHRSVAVNLVIDSDAMRSAAIRLPTGPLANPMVETIAFDRAGGETPYEEHSIIDREMFCSFGTRVMQTMESLVPNPLIRDFWPLVIERGREQKNLGLALSQARHRVEGQWGNHTLELPQSRLCEFPSFRRFAHGLLSEASRLREHYNQAVSEYRRANHIRSKAHPVPDLLAADGWIEAPFWVWTSQEPRRRRLFVRRSGNALRLSDRGELDLSLAVSHESAFEQFESLERRGIKLRTRALMTTMFARLMLGDLFLHGIGGAKYDQVTDAIIRRYFGIDPPAFMTVTATLRLPVARPDACEDDLRLVEQRLRELEFHAERWLDASDATAQSSTVQSAIAEKLRWIATPQNHQNARARCQAIRRANQALQGNLAKFRTSLVAERESLRHDLRVEKAIGSREYAFCLHPAEKLRELIASPGDVRQNSSR